MLDLVLYVGLLSLAIAAVWDVLFRIIPDQCVLFVTLTGLVVRIGEGGGSVIAGLGVALAAFAFLLMLFRLGAVGGGDVKLLPAVSLLFPASQAMPLFIFISLAGGILAIFVCAVNAVTAKGKVPGASAKAEPRSEAVAEDVDPGYQGHGIPYGVAIFAGALINQALLP